MTASTMAPARTPTPTAPPERMEPAMDTVVVLPQHMAALARANEVRLARAQLKREIGSGQRAILEVIRECPWEAESMSVSELLCSQRRWGRARSRKLINSLQLSETKRLGTFTQRQRDLLAAALEARGATC
jgi:hypothetical protein